MVLEATQQLPDLFPFNEDMSGGDHSLLGIGFLQSSAGQGSRSSSSTSYLAQANSRPNLTVLINTTVLKLLQSQSTQATSNAVPSFRKVQIGASPGTASSPAGE
jgi:choline dehydrogenase